MGYLQATKSSKANLSFAILLQHKNIIISCKKQNYVQNSLLNSMGIKSIILTYFWNDYGTLNDTLRFIKSHEKSFFFLQLNWNNILNWFEIMCVEMLVADYLFLPHHTTSEMKYEECSIISVFSLNVQW